jgi:histidine triad (HIT) family protein
MENCIFCKIIHNEIAAPRIYEDESTIVIKDLSPQAPYHYLALPRKHFAGIQDVPESDTQLLQTLFSAIAKTVKKEKLDEKGYRLVVNYGDNAGQSVHHIHVHILSGRQFHWPPG